MNNKFHVTLTLFFSIIVNNNRCSPASSPLLKLTDGYFLFTVGEHVLEKWSDKLDAAIDALKQSGSWEFIESRRVVYFTAYNERAKVVVLRINKK